MKKEHPCLVSFILMPINARINKESDVRFQAVDVGRILAEMENATNGLNIVMLDACRAGKVKLLGVFSDKRLRSAPDVPTLKEQGVNVTYHQNRGLVAPADIPADARKVLERAFAKYMKTDTFRNYIADNTLSEAWMDGETFGAWLDKENAMYAVILKNMGLNRKR